MRIERIELKNNKENIFELISSDLNKNKIENINEIRKIEPA